MDTTQKQLLGWAGFGVMIIAGIFLVAKTNETLNTAASTNTVSFSGEGKVLAKPDIGLIELSIVTEAATSQVAQTDNSTKSNAVTDYLKKAGVDEKDIKTTSYNIYPQYDYSSGRNILRGYQVSETLQVKVRDLTKADEILAGVVSAGTNQINSFQLAIDDPEKLQDQAREKAIADAKQKANVLEGELGISLGRIVNFTEGSQGVPGPVFMKADSMGMGGGPVTPSIQTGENEITVDVTITYQIK